MPVIYTLEQAPLLIRLHLASALLAVPVGGLVLWRRKGTLHHRWLGRAWLGLMLFVSVGSFWIGFYPVSTDTFE